MRWLLLVLIVECCFCRPVRGQSENNRWYFGQNAGLDFSGGGPAPLMDGKSTGSASTVVSDAGGALLFYSDGYFVRDRRHQVMPNGFGLTADIEWPQSVAVVPVVDAPGQYFVFTVSSIREGGALRYTIVDMNRNGGFGEVVAGRKNVLLREGVYPVLITAEADCGVWLITCDQTQFNTSVFVAFRIDHDGIDFPVLTSQNALGRGERGLRSLILRLSPDRRQLVLGATFVGGARSQPPGPVDDYIHAFRFISADGRVVLNGRLDSPGFQDIQGLAFSPDNRFLYTNELTPQGGRAIYQYDFTLADTRLITGSRLEVGRAGDECGACLGALAAGPDGRIYVARDGQTFLGVVRAPNVAGAGSDYLDRGVDLGTGSSRRGLPNFFTPIFQVVEPLIVRDTLLCRGYPFDLVAAPGFAAYRWQDGAAGPRYAVNRAGRYLLEATYQGCLIRDTVDVRDRIDTNGIIGPDTAFCLGGSLPLDAATPGGSDYRWSDGVAGPSRILAEPATLWVEFSNGQCPVRDSIVVTTQPPPALDLGPDTLLCFDEDLLLSPTVAAVSLQWQDGYRDLPYRISEPGEYWLEIVGSGGCAARDSIRVRYSRLSPVTLEFVDQEPCIGEAVTLRIRPPDVGAIRWQDGATTTTYPVAASGMYSVEVSDGRCRFRDSVTVAFRDCCTLFAPTIFSPNGDGANDRYQVFFGCAVTAFRLRIFTRHGQLLYDTTDQSAGWDGGFGARAAAPGVYVYVVEYRFAGDADSGFRRTLGDVTLLR